MLVNARRLRIIGTFHACKQHESFEICLHSSSANPNPTFVSSILPVCPLYMTSLPCFWKPILWRVLLTLATVTSVKGVASPSVPVSTPTYSEQTQKVVRYETKRERGPLEPHLKGRIDGMMGGHSIHTPNQKSLLPQSRRGSQDSLHDSEGGNEKKRNAKKQNTR